MNAAKTIEVLVTKGGIVCDEALTKTLNTLSQDKDGDVHKCAMIALSNINKTEK